VKQFEVW